MIPQTSYLLNLVALSFSLSLFLSPKSLSLFFYFSPSLSLFSLSLILSFSLSSIYLSLSLSSFFSLFLLIICVQAAWPTYSWSTANRVWLRLLPMSCSVYTVVWNHKNLTSNITEIPTPGFIATTYIYSEQSLSYKTSCPSGLLCVRNPESKGKAGGPWTHRWHGPMKTHLCRRENVPANSFCQKWQGGQAKKPPMPTCHDMKWHDMLM